MEVIFAYLLSVDFFLCASRLFIVSFSFFIFPYILPWCLYSYPMLVALLILLSCWFVCL